MMKIFEVGIMRTGTTSLGLAYEILGFKHKGCDHILNEELNEKEDYNILFDVIDKYDAFEDVPCQSVEVKILEIIFNPIVLILTLMIKAIDKRSKLNDPGNNNSITEEELLTLIDIGEEEGSFEPQEAEMIENVFRFGDSQAQEIMTPRTEIVSLSSDSTVRNFKDIYSEHSHSRFPVYEGSEDNVIGIISIKDVLMGISKKKTNDETKIKDIF